MVGGGSRRVFEMMPTKKSSAVRQLRRYGGCRLYDPERQAYLAPQDLERLIRQGVRFSVREVVTGQDVTHEVVPPDLQ
jgi:polyhydroxyalkanoate synthesis regulator protein